MRLAWGCCCLPLPCRDRKTEKKKLKRKEKRRDETRTFFCHPQETKEAPPGTNKSVSQVTSPKADRVSLSFFRLLFFSPRPSLRLRLFLRCKLGANTHCDSGPSLPLSLFLLSLSLPHSSSAARTQEGANLQKNKSWEERNPKLLKKTDRICQHRVRMKERDTTVGWG